MTEHYMDTEIEIGLPPKNLYVLHDQVYSPYVDAWLDKNVIFFIEFLKKNNIITLHSCEGDDIKISDMLEPMYEEEVDADYNGKGYIHFYNAQHLEKAIIVSHKLAITMNASFLAENILQEKQFFLNGEGEVVNNYFNWDYEIGWTTVHPWNQQERHNPYEGCSLTAVLRIPHFHLVELNNYAFELL